MYRREKFFSDSDEEQFKSPRKFYKRAKKWWEVDNFDADVVRLIVHKF